jgi:hypothetical protein
MNGSVTRDKCRDEVLGSRFEAQDVKFRNGRDSHLGREACGISGSGVGCTTKGAVISIIGYGR